jgi:ribonuclease HI
MYLGRATNNIAELTAVKCAAEVINENSGPVRIYTDSRYAIGVLTSGWKAKANQTLIAEVKEALVPFSDLKLVYVPGHSGHPLNERADELARLAIYAQQSSGWVKV